MDSWIIEVKNGKLKQLDDEHDKFKVLASSSNSIF